MSNVSVDIVDKNDMTFTDAYFWERDTMVWIWEYWMKM